MESFARGEAALRTRRCATAWGSRRWTRCATTCCSSDSSRMRVQGRRTSTSTLRRAVEKKSSNTCTTRSGAIAQPRSRTSSRTDRARRSAMSRVPSGTLPARRQPGPRAGERCPPSWGMRLRHSRASPGTWGFTREAWCSPINRCHVSARSAGPRCPGVPSSNGTRRTAPMPAS